MSEELKEQMLDALRDSEQALSHALHRLKDDGVFSTKIALEGGTHQSLRGYFSRRRTSRI